MGTLWSVIERHMPSYLPGDRNRELLPGVDFTESRRHCLIGCPDFRGGFLIRLLHFVHQASFPVAVADAGTAEVCAYRDGIL